MSLRPRWQDLAEHHLGELPAIRLSHGPIARWCCWLCGAGAITLGSRILLSAPAEAAIARWGHHGQALLIHEAVHVRQWHQAGTWRFVGTYVAHYLSGRWRGLSHQDAYRAIAAEVEAFGVEAHFRSGATVCSKPAP